MCRFLFLALVACAARPRLESIRSQPLAARLDAVLQKSERAHEFNGVVVVRQHDAIVYRAAFGTGVDVETVFPYASITKQVTALLVMQDVEAGRLSLDQTIAQLLEDVPESARAVTVRQLLQHTSGLPDLEAGTPEGGVPRVYQRTTVGTADVEARSCMTGEYGPAGTFRYNNCDFIVLGAILERVDHATFADLVAHRIVAKLGLHSWGVFDATHQATIHGTDEHGRPSPIVNFATYGAAGALYGDATDLSRWSQALLDHELLGEHATTVMFSGDKDLHMEALGSWEYQLGPIELVERQGDIEGIRTLALLSKTHGFTISILANTERAQLFDLWTRKGLPFELVQEVAK